VRELNRTTIREAMERVVHAREERTDTGPKQVGFVDGDGLVWDASTAEALRSAIWEIDAIGWGKELTLCAMLRALLEDIDNIESWLVN